MGTEFWMFALFPKLPQTAVWIISLVCSFLSRASMLCHREIEIFLPDLFPAFFKVIFSQVFSQGNAFEKCVKRTWIINCTTKWKVCALHAVSIVCFYNYIHLYLNSTKTLHFSTIFLQNCVRMKAPFLQLNLKRSWFLPKPLLIWVSLVDLSLYLIHYSVL